MRRSHLAAATSSAALLLTAAFTGTSVIPSASAVSKGSDDGTATSYVVLADSGASARAVAQRLTAAGGTVSSVNQQIGLISVSSTSAGFRGAAAKVAGVQGVAADRVVGYQPNERPSKVEQESLAAARAGTLRASAKKPPKPVAGDPLDGLLWGMKMIHADQAHAVNQGSKKVKVGVIDTGVQGDHPDLAANFDWKLSRNFAPDVESVDGPCEVASCLDPVGEDDGGHGTHVAGTIAAGLNGFGVSGVAPKVDLVELKAGQDSGFFFLQPTVDALTYAGDRGIDVVNMSFYVDPWLYNCTANPADSPAAQAEQRTIITAVQRALDYAHAHGVTLVSAAGNEHDNLAAPRTDTTSPDFPANSTYPRPVDNATCLNLPAEGSHVIGVTSLGPSGKKSDYSNYTTDPTSGEVELSAPGGWFRDGFGTPTFRTNENEILSTYPTKVAIEEGYIDEAGNDINGLGSKYVCPPKVPHGAASCGVYVYLQGTSMASPHAAGVAALAVAAHGKNTRGEFGLAPNLVRAYLQDSATDHACPNPPLQTYTAEGRSAEFNALCVGSPELNGFYGHGIVNALAVLR